MTYYKIVIETINTRLKQYYASHNMEYIKMYFRGQAQDWKLSPTIMRPDQTKKEHEIIASAIKNGQWHTNKSLFENIAFLQHYGTPTRFLDYTTNIDIALYFACRDEAHYDSDGIIYICAYRPRKSLSMDTTMITELCLLEEKISSFDLAKRIMQKSGIDCANEYDIKDYAIVILSWIDHGFMVEPSADELLRIKDWNPRMVNQNGVFFILGNELEEPNLFRSTYYCKHHIIKPKISDVPSIIKHEDYIIKIPIPKEYKPDIIKHLAEKGINDAFILAH